MTNISCSRRDCVWCCIGERACLNPSVVIDENGCVSFYSVQNLQGYQEKFWMAKRIKNDPFFRIEAQGKKIEYRGRVFYTVEQTDERGAFIVTDGMTGAECGTFAYVKKNWDRYLAAVEKLPDVMTYPAAAVVGGKLIPIDDEPEEDEPSVVSSEEFTGILDSLKQMYGGG